MLSGNQNDRYIHKVGIILKDGVPMTFREVAEELNRKDLLEKELKSALLILKGVTDERPSEK